MAHWLSLAILALVALPLASKKMHPTVALMQRSGREVHEHKLRICNAFPFSAAVAIYSGKTLITKDKPLAYKTCADYNVALRIDDKLNFIIGDNDAGTFSVSELPRGDSMLLLVVHRNDAKSTIASFASHTFEETDKPQIAVIDTYTGTSNNKLEIRTKDTAELLHFGRVINVKPDAYFVRLVSHKNETHADDTLVAETRRNYVVMRVGIEAELGPSFPEELVVFPKKDAAKTPDILKNVKSGASTNRGTLLTLAVLAAVVMRIA